MQQLQLSHIIADRQCLRQPCSMPLKLSCSMYHSLGAALLTANIAPVALGFSNMHTTQAWRCRALVVIQSVTLL